MKDNLNIGHVLVHYSNVICIQMSVFKWSLLKWKIIFFCLLAMLAIQNGSPPSTSFAATHSRLDGGLAMGAAATAVASPSAAANSRATDQVSF